MRALVGLVAVVAPAAALLHLSPYLHRAPLLRTSSRARLPPLRTTATATTTHVGELNDASPWRAALSWLELTPFQVQRATVPPSACQMIYPDTGLTPPTTIYRHLAGARPLPCYFFWLFHRRTRSRPGWPRARRKKGELHTPSSRAIRQRLRWPTSKRGSRRRPRRCVRRVAVLHFFELNLVEVPLGLSPATRGR